MTEGKLLHKNIQSKNAFVGCLVKTGISMGTGQYKDMQSPSWHLLVQSQQWKHQNNM